MTEKQQKIIRYSSIVLGSIILSVFLLFLLVLAGAFGKLPGEKELKQVTRFYPTTILDHKDRTITRVYLQDRTPVTYDQISPFIKEVLIAVEDKRFLEHDGIDYRSLFRVIVKSILLQDESAGGGSTLTQQLAKNLYPRINIPLLYYPVNKMREMIIARRIEKLYTKEEILTLYLNTVSFGLELYGVESASRRFFDKSCANVTQQEAITLVGMLKATTYYNPVLNPERSRERRDFLIHFLAEQEIIDPSKADSLAGTPLDVTGKEVDNVLAPYFAVQVQKEVNSLLADLYPDSSYDLHRDGLTIKTTLDNDLQASAEKAMKKSMTRLQASFDKVVNDRFWKKNEAALAAELEKSGEKGKENALKMMSVFTHEGNVQKELTALDSLKHYLAFLQSGFLAAHPSTGEVRAWIGGIDFTYFPYDHVKSRRQVGSTIKPFIYAAGLEKGLSPCTYYETRAVTYNMEDENWRPTNSNDSLAEKITMETALAKSVNTVSVKILQETGISRAQSLLKSAGIEAEIPAVPSIALGTPSISLWEMVQAYTIFANEGRLSKLFMVKSITDRYGNVLYEYKAQPKVKVISQSTAQMVRHFMQKAVNEGTGASMRSAYLVYNDMGGKTGTTQNGSDGWFMSVTPDLVSGAWVGGTYPSITFGGGYMAQGSRMALPIVARTFQGINASRTLRNRYGRAFEPLPESLQMELECDPVKRERRFLEWLFGRDEEIPSDTSAVEWNDTIPKEDNSGESGGLFDQIKKLLKNNRNRN